MDMDALITQYSLSPRMLTANTAGLTHEDSLRQPRPAGNCLNWVVGHLVQSRLHVLALLDKKPPFASDKFARYGQGSKPITEASQALPFDELMDSFLALQKPVEEALREASPEELGKRVENSPTGNPDETVASFLPACAFFECYYIGQTGLLRRLAGKEAPLQ